MTLIVSLILPSFHGLEARLAAAEQTPAEPPAFRLAYVPRDALALVAFRPGALLQRPAIEPFAEAIHEMFTESLDSPLQPSDVKQFIMFMLPNSRGTAFPAMIFHTASRDAADAVVTMLDVEPQTSTFAGHTYQGSGRLGCVCRLNETAILATPDDTTMRRCLAAGKVGATRTRWADRWATVATSDVAAVANTSLTRAFPPHLVAAGLRKIAHDRYTRDEVQLTAFTLSPLWQRSDIAVAELTVTDQIRLRIISQSGTVEEANEVYSAMLSAIACGRLMLSRLRERAVLEDASGPILMQQIDLFDELLEDATVVRKESQVGVLVHMDKESTQAVTAMAVPVTLAARAARYRTRCTNNLKLIAHAFHNYHDTYKTLPAASQIGPKEVAHSWRISILPFVGQRELYEAYRQDEPWDSEHNLQLLEKIPDVYRCPGDRRNSTNTSYFVFDGPEAALDNRRYEGSFRSITDGTSNTLLAVESKRAVPWTKPEDIPFDPEQPPPKIGGWHPTGFCAAFCDGSVRMLPTALDEQMLKHLIMRADGNPIQLPPP